MIRLEDLQVFVHAARSGGFSAAARLLDLSPASASAAILRLEQAVGRRLFVRSTRKMRLSEEGERYLPHAMAALAALEAGDEALAQGGGALAGPLRLSLPSDLGRNVVRPWFDDFLRLNPRLTLHLQVSDQMADFFQVALDASLRYGQLADSNLVALPIVADNRRCLCAAPSYLERHGRPHTPDELHRHNCLRFVLHEQTFDRWKFHMPQGVQTVAVGGDRICDDGDLARRWGIDGHGILYKSRIDVLDDLRAGRLVELLPPACGDPVPLQLIAAHRASISPSIARLRDFLVARFNDFLAI